MHARLTPVFCLLWAANANAQPVWSYDGDRNGQDEWANLSAEFVTCGGASQSPIVIGTTKAQSLPALSFNYGKDKISLAHDRYSVVITPSSAQQLQIGDEKLRLREMLIRTPSEHDVRGKFYPFELQLLHEYNQDKKTILAIFMEMGDPNPALDGLIAGLPARDKKASADFDWQSLLPAERGYYAYTGSITTPPCTEGVAWRILKSPISLSYEQAKKITSLLGRNARLPQPAYLRQIEETE